MNHPSLIPQPHADHSVGGAAGGRREQGIAPVMKRGSVTTLSWKSIVEAMQQTMSVKVLLLALLRVPPVTVRRIRRGCQIGQLWSVDIGSTPATEDRQRRYHAVDKSSGKSQPPEKRS
jgi:hypothetical protein